MFWSSSSSSPAAEKAASGDANSASSAPSSPGLSSAASDSSTTASTTSTSTTGSAGWSADGPAGLGVISSLSPECTPLKHRYDSCFDRWFTDYLAIGDAQILEQQRQGNGDPSASHAGAADPPRKKKSSWFGGGSEDQQPSASSSAGAKSGLFATSGGVSADPDLERRKREVMERYESDCGKLFSEYRACVKRAASAKGLDALIEEARAENPFPFDHERRADGRENNPPFPFPAARRPTE
ncbi:uncharacterized protein PFL1_04632 [Pseudozyma flocculosa PF-1]|uniref:Uncharacterized protein n=2 Tax=Pseudozyma flocculosa TaxID=84751 RepID=A0A5C3FE92_9BASI|nr:uncharacterized protein PFL1_04632 [Pseudozyma flocculosa PF-1]EPQ27888.1 hypothetical protein PFL1_04632 [Pseudozyma flocculosa PF-1]SPO41669.1 uncharacterized protein PSFLO_07151 [Pseudozyma flocculosa]